MPYKAVLFDLDGTLLGALEDLASACNRVRTSLGLPSHPLVAFQKEYAACWQAHSRPYPGIPEMLDALTAAGLRLGVLSNKPDAFTKLFVRTLLDRWRFDPVLGQRENVPKKPNPAGALEAARIMGVAPAETFFVGDSGVDVLKAAGADMLDAEPADIPRFLEQSAG